MTGKPPLRGWREAVVVLGVTLLILFVLGFAFVLWAYSQIDFDQID
jgi:hypothetical protein